MATQTTPCKALLLGVGIAALCTPLALAQPSYSVDYQSAIKGGLDMAGTAITEGDILGTTFTPGSPPKVLISAGAPTGLALVAYPNAVGLPSWMAGQVEVDALSYGFDLKVESSPAVFYPTQWVFSVDEFAIGLQPNPVPVPSVSTEGGLTGQQASADIFGTFPPGAYPPGVGWMLPFMMPPGNIDILDGDGAGPLAPFSLGLLEPNAPTLGAFDPGDNLDALDIDTIVPPGGIFPVYFSLDSGTTFDGIEMVPGTGSAIVNGAFVGGDVLVTPAPGAPPVLYASAASLGLDLLGPDTDDLDALVLRENGDGIFTPSVNPYQWESGSDMLFFSVRRGSAIIGAPAFFSGLPIEEGDILFPAGPLGTPPGVWIAAENLGLCPNLRVSGVPLPWSCPIGPWGPRADDLNALDVARDCDDDGMPDAIAIALGLAQDLNGNGLPDACEPGQKFTRGDCNVDSSFNIADPVYALGFLFPGPTGPNVFLCDDACDANDDGFLNIADPVRMLNWLFGAPGVPLPAPFPGCGLDPTPMDPFACASFVYCP